LFLKKSELRKKEKSIKICTYFLLEKEKILVTAELNHLIKLSGWVICPVDLKKNI